MNTIRSSSVMEDPPSFLRELLTEHHHQQPLDPADHQIAQQLYRRMNNDVALQKGWSADQHDHYSGAHHQHHHQSSSSLISQVLRSIRDDGDCNSKNTPNPYNDARRILLIQQQRLKAPPTGDHPNLQCQHDDDAGLDDSNFCLEPSSFSSESWQNMPERSLNDEAQDQRSIYDHLAEHRERMNVFSTLQALRGEASMANKSAWDADAFDRCVIPEEQDHDADDLIFEIEL
ncbi:unnamed protein product [Cylindrotheca closterium]|uniref:Uncharacterized protein n=1 Tax=Cylindrotheca closterium TaxID=2856 RepID=A0AAD2JMP5_9STRA|nr:unnamed protein product [Cylindrotheca closterium]